jgi:hypothetical protein
MTYNPQRSKGMLRRRKEWVERLISAGDKQAQSWWHFVHLAAIPVAWEFQNGHFEINQLGS